ncbi:Fic family protein [Candidatus Peregrinibacteria bacterium]|nr:Fic family protein [Candidatus Peregrinibacteria bacterium]
MIKKIEELQIKINSRKPFSKEILKLWQEKLRIDWTYNSNAIEGNTLTYGETAFFLREGLTSEGKPLKDYLEAKNHAEAIDYLLDVIKGDREITESFIKELHALLLKDIHFTYAKGGNGQLIKKPLNAGKYKVLPNHVLTISGKIHKYTDPIHVKDEMEELIKWFNKEKTINIIEKACIFHYKFAAIHPFDDGNGRMARLLMNLILMRAGYPPCIIKNINRRKYLESLELIDAENNRQPFVVFICEELLSTQKIMLDILEGKESALKDYPKKMNRDEREEKIINAIDEKSISISQIIEKIPQIKRPTLKSDLNRLIKAKKVKRNGTGKGAVYTKFKK